MNGDWVPWGLGVNGNTARDYVAAWRHLVTVFAEEGASNVRWVWSPNVNPDGYLPFERLYPGDRWVDWLALDRVQLRRWARVAIVHRHLRLLL